MWLGCEEKNTKLFATVLKGWLAEISVDARESERIIGVFATTRRCAIHIHIYFTLLCYEGVFALIMSWLWVHSTGQHGS